MAPCKSEADYFSTAPRTSLLLMSESGCLSRSAKGWAYKQVDDRIPRGARRMRRLSNADAPLRTSPRFRSARPLVVRDSPRGTYYTNSDADHYLRTSVFRPRTKCLRNTWRYQRRTSPVIQFVTDAASTNLINDRLCTLTVQLRDLRRSKDALTAPLTHPLKPLFDLKRKGPNHRNAAPNNATTDIVTKTDFPLLGTGASSLDGDYLERT